MHNKQLPALKFINDRLQTIPYAQRKLGITFWPKRPEFAEREKIARARAYKGREVEDKAFRAHWNLD